MFTLPTYALPVKVQEVGKIFILDRKVGMKIRRFIKLQSGTNFSGHRSTSWRENTHTLVALETDEGWYLVTIDQDLPRKGEFCILLHDMLHHEDGTVIELHRRRSTASK